MSEVNEFGQTLGCAMMHWRPVNPPSIKVLQGKFCRLEKFLIDQHAEPLFSNLKWDNQGESWTYLPYGPFATFADFVTWLHATISEVDTVLYAILDNKTLLPIGLAGYLRINPTHGSIEIGHLHFSTLLKRTPAATEAMYLMMNYAFETLKYRRYEWKCNALNQSSWNAALRLGFTFEGVFRQSNVFKGRNRDTAWFSILDKEWPAIKRRLENWLSDSNFDEMGRQRKRLSDM